MQIRKSVWKDSLQEKHRIRLIFSLTLEANFLKAKRKSSCQLKIKAKTLTNEIENNSTLIEALANEFESEDTIMRQVNEHIAQHNKTNSWKKQTDAFEISEINQLSPNNYEPPSTPVKPSSSEKDKN